jgi:hypothetical protein
MAKQAAAMVKWQIFRPGKGTGGAAVYDYGSDKKLLHQRVADAGTLWLITSTRKSKEPRRYHLAYKLANCKIVRPEESIFSGKWKYVVRAQDWEKSCHFGYNDATDTLRRLQFTSGKSMSEVTNMGLRLLSIPELNPEDVTLLKRLQHKIVNGRTAFVSYSRADASLAAKIESELGKRDVSVSRDVAFLKPGQEWAEALLQEVSGTDSFMVLISPNAAKSTWVRREVNWALSEYEASGLVKSVIPVVLPRGGWEHFPELHRFERWDFPVSSRQEEEYDRLVEGIRVSTTLKGE